MNVKVSMAVSERNPNSKILKEVFYLFFIFKKKGKEKYSIYSLLFIILKKLKKLI